MNKWILILSLSLSLIGCGRLTNQASNYIGPDFFYTDSNQKLFKFDSEVKEVKMNNAVNQLSVASNQKILSSSQKSVNILSSSGEQIITFSTDDQVQASVINSKLNKIIYVTNLGKLKLYDVETKHITTIKERLYPVPRQIILNHDESEIIFHNRVNVYSFNLDSMKKTKLTSRAYPIHTIAYNSDNQDIYFSSSIDGKLYAVTGQYIRKLYAPRSVTGSAISFDESSQSLFFTQSNGMDINIKAINILSEEVTEYISLKNIHYISSIAVVN